MSGEGESERLRGEALPWRGEELFEAEVTEAGRGCEAWKEWKGEVEG